MPPQPQPQPPPPLSHPWFLRKYLPHHFLHIICERINRRIAPAVTMAMACISFTASPSAALRNISIINAIGLSLIM
jgi:hypothetical protein